MMNKNFYNTAPVLSAALSVNALAAVSADEAKQLGGSTLTVMGAEKTGNKDGSIPKYTGQVLILKVNPKEPGYPTSWQTKFRGKLTPPKSAAHFSPEALAGEGIR